MAYQSFYRTYRPSTFSEVVGQQPIIKTIKNSLANNKIGHAYLFCGPRGTGKTTLARLFAKSLNCEEGLGHECNHCSNCQAITSGKHPDVYEIDAASNSGVDNVRDLIEQVRYEPILGRYKIYIIDEVHSMTPSAFNALLKTLEEPPSNVIFILATTEPQKVLPTILSRVQRFDFSKISADDLVLKMIFVLDNEKIEYDRNSLKLISRLADGGARDALSILEQVVSYGGNSIKIEDVQTLFGLVSVAEKIKIVNYLHDGLMKELITMIKELYSKGSDLVRLHDDLINIYKDLLIFGTTKDESLLTILKPEEALQLLIGPSEIRRNLDHLQETRRTYRLVNNSFDHFELSLIKLLGKPEDKKSIAQAEPINVSQTIKKVSKSNDSLSLAEELLKKPNIQEKPFFPAPPMISDDTLIHYTDDDIINIMIQGDKKLKESVISSWNVLNDYRSDPELGIYASFLMSSSPRIINHSIMVVEVALINQIKRINSLAGRPYFQKLIAQAFGFSPAVYALTAEEYIKSVEHFRQLNQIGKLPTPKPITNI